jgi:hypothetical protein
MTTRRLAVRRRLADYAAHLEAHGTINRRDMMRIGEISVAQASADLAALIEDFPGFGLAYDRSAKTYRVTTNNHALKGPHMEEAAIETEIQPNAPVPEPDGWEWAIIEVFGHRRHAGRTREEERFGAKLLRIDVPVKGDAAANGWETIYYGGSSIFSFSLSDEATCRRINKPYEPPARRSLPAPDGDDLDVDEQF